MSKPMPFFAKDSEEAQLIMEFLTEDTRKIFFIALESFLRGHLSNNDFAETVRDLAEWAHGCIEEAHEHARRERSRYGT